MKKIVGLQNNNLLDSRYIIHGHEYISNILDSKIIEESGTGYIKYADGTMICYGTSSTTSNLTTYYSTLYRTNEITITYPQEFISAPTVNITPYGHQSIGASINTNYLRTDKVIFWILKGYGASDTTCEYCYTAIGKWK